MIEKIKAILAAYRIYRESKPVNIYLHELPEWEVSDRLQTAKFFRSPTGAKLYELLRHHEAHRMANACLSDSSSDVAKGYHLAVQQILECSLIPEPENADDEEEEDS